MDGDDAVVCTICGATYRRRGGVWRFLTLARSERLAPFMRQYRAVREQEGYRPTTAAYYRRLPTVAATDPHAGDWQIRRETYHHFLGHVLAAGALPLHVLDLRAASCCLS